MAGNKEIMKQFQSGARQQRALMGQGNQEKPTQYFVRKEQMDAVVEQLEATIADLSTELEVVKKHKYEVRFPDISTVQKSVSIPVLTEQGGLQTMQQPLLGQIPIGRADKSYMPGYIDTAYRTVVTKTLNYIAVASDGIILADATGGSLTITLPSAVGIKGKTYSVKRLNAGANTVTVAAAGAETIDGASTEVLTMQYVSIDLVSDDANWSIL